MKIIVKVENKLNWCVKADDEHSYPNLKHGA